MSRKRVHDADVEELAGDVGELASDLAEADATGDGEATDGELAGNDADVVEAAGGGGPGASETKGDKFMRIAAPRVSKVLTALRTLTSLTNTSSYAWSEEQEAKMFGAIYGAVDELKAAFQHARTSRGKSGGGKVGWGF